MALYVICDTPGSKFAKAIRDKVRELVADNVYIVSNTRYTQLSQRRRFRGKSVFRVTTQPLDKIEQLVRFHQHEVPHPAYTSNKELLGTLNAKTIFARTLINSTNGRGIVEFDWPATGPIPDAPLYTAYIPKKAEYRVHVFAGKVIDIQQKKKKRGFEGERDTRVRNMANGYVYTREGVVGDPRLHDCAIRAVASLGYQYGAVDVIYNEKQNQYYVLEVNSRPGLMGTTLAKYGNAIVENMENG